MHKKALYILKGKERGMMSFYYIRLKIDLKLKIKVQYIQTSGKVKYFACLTVFITCVWFIKKVNMSVR